MKCTWVDCDSEAIQPHVAKGGDVWANLCAIHSNQLEDDCGPFQKDVRKLLSSWVKANGGSGPMAKRMLKRKKKAT